MGGNHHCRHILGVCGSVEEGGGGGGAGGGENEAGRWWWSGRGAWRMGNTHVVLDIEVGAGGDEQLDGLEVAFPRCIYQRCVAICWEWDLNPGYLRRKRTTTRRRREGRGGGERRGGGPTTAVARARVRRAWCGGVGRARRPDDAEHGTTAPNGVRRRARRRRERSRWRAVRRDARWWCGDGSGRVEGLRGAAGGAHDTRSTRV